MSDRRRIRALLAACHGADGKGGAALSLGDPVYLAIADDGVVRKVVTNGITGTSMPAFAKSAGGMLTDKQVEIIVRGLRERYAKPDLLAGAVVPPYAAAEPGDAARGAAAYATFCASCHGAGGKGGPKGGSIVNGSFLALLPDQELRTLVIVGRPDLGAPDWRNDLPGKPMSSQEISDVVAWLAAQRPLFVGGPYPNAAKAAGELGDPRCSHRAVSAVSAGAQPESQERRLAASGFDRSISGGRNAPRNVPQCGYSAVGWQDRRKRLLGAAHRRAHVSGFRDQLRTPRVPGALVSAVWAVYVPMSWGCVLPGWVAGVRSTGTRPVRVSVPHSGRKASH